MKTFIGLAIGALCSILLAAGLNEAYPVLGTGFGVIGSLLILATVVYAGGNEILPDFHRPRLTVANVFYTAFFFSSFVAIALLVVFGGDQMSLGAILVKFI